MELINFRVNLFRQCMYVGFENGLYLFNLEVFIGRGYADHFEIGILNNYIFIFYEG